jgi:hypothetical protein
VASWSLKKEKKKKQKSLCLSLSVSLVKFPPFQVDDLNICHLNLVLIIFRVQVVDEDGPLNILSGKRKNLHWIWYFVVTCRHLFHGPWPFLGMFWRYFNVLLLSLKWDCGVGLMMGFTVFLSSWWFCLWQILGFSLDNSLGCYCYLISTFCHSLINWFWWFLFVWAMGILEPKI